MGTLIWSDGGDWEGERLVICLISTQPKRWHVYRREEGKSYYKSKEFTICRIHHFPAFWNFQPPQLAGTNRASLGTSLTTPAASLAQ